MEGMKKYPPPWRLRGGWVRHDRDITGALSNLTLTVARQIVGLEGGLMLMPLKI